MILNKLEVLWSSNLNAAALPSSMLTAYQPTSVLLSKLKCRGMFVPLYVKQYSDLKTFGRFMTWGGYLGTVFWCSCKTSSTVRGIHITNERKKLCMPCRCVCVTNTNKENLCIRETMLTEKKQHSGQSWIRIIFTAAWMAVHSTIHPRCHFFLLSPPPFRFLGHLECQHLCLQHLLLHEPPLLLATDGSRFHALHLCLGLGSFLGQQLSLLLRDLGLFS